MPRGEIIEHERAERRIRLTVVVLALLGTVLVSLGWGLLTLREVASLGEIARESGQIDAVRFGTTVEARLVRVLWLGTLFTGALLVLMLIWSILLNRRIAAVLQSMRYRLRDLRQGLLNMNATLEQRVRDETERRVGMFQSTIVDELTGLSNRWHFDWLLEQELRRARRSGQPLVLALADVDGLHALNAAHGAAAGDRVLVRVAGILRAATQRAGDTVARYGGDEFALIMPDTTIPGALEVVFTVREHLATLESPDPDGEVDSPVTLSFGLVATDASSRHALHDLVEAAQGALARARGSGGDSVEVG